MPPVSQEVDRAPLIVALDAGTSSVRALAFDGLGRAIGETEEQLPYSLEITPDGGATFPAEPLFDLTVRAIDGVAARLGDAAARVAAVGSTSFWHSLMGIDATGTPTTPVFYWADTRSSPEATALRTELDADAVWQRTGCRLHSSYWPAKLRWLRRTDPDTFRRTSRWLSFAEYALGRLCHDEAGAATICMASGTGLLDVHAMIWDAEMLELSGIDADRLSPLVDLGPPGCLRADFASRWPTLADTHWFPALGDGACANVGSGAVGPSRIALTVGTSAAVRMILPQPPDEPWVVPHGLWAYRLDRGRAVLGGALSNGGNLLRWIWNTTGTDRGDETTTAAAALAPDSTGLTFLPFLAGERSPGWHDDASGVIAGLTVSTRPEHLIRAGMEAVAYRLADVYDALRPLASTEHEIVASGGAILVLPSWLQITADALGHTLIASTPGDEATARGAALMAAVEAGILSGIDVDSDVAAGTSRYVPNMAHYERYRTGRERQARLEQTLLLTGEFI
jgi:gluconokinase